MMKEVLLLFIYARLKRIPGEGTVRGLRRSSSEKRDRAPEMRAILRSTH